jgi:hypothetical protein
VTAPKTSGEDGDAPYFPRPRRLEEPSPYRKAAAPRRVDHEVEAVKPPVVVSRPEPPDPVPALRPRSTPKPPPPRPPIVVTGAQAAADPPIARIVERYPRHFGAGALLLGGWLFASGVLDDVRTPEQAARYVTVHKASYFHVSAGVAALGLWLLLCGIPIEKKTGRPPDWWGPGLFVLVVFAIGGRSQLAALVIALLG